MDRSVPEGPWRFFSIILALLAASGPVTALINGIFDRELEKAKFENDQNLQYVELILAEYHNEDERRSAYQFMDIALNASNPSRVIKDHVQQKLADYDKRDRLTADLWAAKSALAETERQNIKLANTINELTARLSGATAHDTMELTIDLRIRNVLSCCEEVRDATSGQPGGAGATA
jgi:hypothetical protein